MLISADPALISKRAWTAAFQGLQQRLAANRQKLQTLRLKTADGFSVFDFIDPSENVLSDILAFLLTPDATHGQGTLFLEILLNHASASKAPAADNATVAREALTFAIENHRRRLDILVTLPDFMFAIETKKYTSEGQNQIRDYCKHLQKISRNRFCLVFLTRTGEEAISIPKKAAAKLHAEGHLVCWSWEKDIPAWLDKCRRGCKAPKIQHFLKDFQTYIAAYLATNQPEETNDEEE